jgi:hypothetical protein
MPPFDLDLTDPTTAALEAAMCDAVKTANGKARVGLLKEDRADYQAFLAGEFAATEGVMMWLSDKGRVASYPPTPRGTLLGVVWRTTPLGRSVHVAGRRIEPFQEGPTHRFGPPYRAVPPLCLLDADHVVLRTFSGGEPEAIAICECGAVGPPDKLAWEAEGRCGPCHDHFVEHGTPLGPSEGPPALRTTGQLRNVGFLPSGKTVAAYEWLAGPSGYNATRQVAVWDRLTGVCRTESIIHPPGTWKAFSRATFAAGMLLRCRSPALWVAEKGQAIGLGAPRYECAMTLHGTTLVALAYGGEVWRRDLTAEDDWTSCWPDRASRNELYYAVAVSPDGKRAALGREECGIDLVEWPSGDRIVTLRPPAQGGVDLDVKRPHVLAFSPDGKLLAAGVGLSGFVEDPSREWFGWGGGLHLYDAVKGEFLVGFDRPTDDVLAVAFSPDGEYLFWGATDCQVRAIDVKTRQETAVLSGHVGCVNDLAFSPDGQTLASAGGDGLVRLWPWRQLLERAAAKKGRARKKG